ncbi:hypothetical protein [Streptomyces sp. NBC_01723]|uniref:hypothetical protein n=1 Tax=Streptomyces sp. NBC_01723 TaxID=2975921 RepID=UPI002E34B205|nr:hypothetical protein [Streptomyces sp. NBC_01723]
MAAVHLGWEPMTRLLPHPDRPDLLATVRLADATRTTVAPGSYDAVRYRHSSRFPFSGVALPLDLRGELADAARTDVLSPRPLERPPQLAVLATAQDRRTDWLHAGQALERVLLLATASGVQASLLHQAVEWADCAAGSVTRRLRVAPGRRW